MTAPTPSQPGTITFLFTDIEHSTLLEQQLGTDRYAEVLERHRSILRAAFDANDGDEQGTEGDSFFVTFGRATAAVSAAIAGQRGLHGEAWPDGIDLRVRMGVHTGEPEAFGIGEARSLIGVDINQAARIAGVAHGGQILVSQQTASLLEHRLADDVHLRDLGAFRLKDLLAPIHLVQVIVDGLPSEFPAPRTPDAHPNNLPTQLTTFVGREVELEASADAAGRDPAADPDRPGRNRQDPPVAAARRPRLGRLPRWCLLRPARADPRPDARGATDRRRGRRDRGRCTPDRRLAGRLAA